MTKSKKERVLNSIGEFQEYILEHGKQLSNNRGGVCVAKGSSSIDPEIAVFIAFWRPGTEEIVQIIHRNIGLYQDKIVSNIGLSEEAASILMKQLAHTLGYKLTPNESTPAGGS